MDYKYKIGKKTYYQNPIVLGQVKQLEGILKDFAIPGNFDVITLISLFGNKLHCPLAIVLVEEGKTLADRFHVGQALPANGAVVGYEPVPEIMSQITLDIATNCDLETSIRVVEDFFVCNPTASIFQRLMGLMASLGVNPKSEIRNPNPAEGGLTNSASSSPGETSPGETPYSGDTPSPSANPTSNTASGT